MTVAAGEEKWTIYSQETFRLSGELRGADQALMQDDLSRPAAADRFVREDGDTS